MVEARVLAGGSELSPAGLATPHVMPSSSSTTRVVRALLVAAVLALAAPAAGRASSGGASAPPTGGGTSPIPAATINTKTAIVLGDAACVPVAHCDGNPHHVSAHGSLLLSGNGLRSAMVVSFPRTRGGRPGVRGLLAHVHKSSLGLVVTVPASAHDGHIAMLLSGGRISDQVGPIYVVHHALHPPKPPPIAVTGGAGAGPLDGQGMWIWYLSKSDGGALPNIVAQAHAAGVTTLYIKSSDGSTNYWSQFSAPTVAALHAAGLRVCAWQYVYGSYPAQEASLGVQAVQAGADCLVIDAESEYEGRYAAAQTYITALRTALGPSYPIALASFPYNDYHPELPYSVFLGASGAQYDLPQMYWKDIGTTVDAAFAHTYEFNRMYGRPIYPLGQTFQNPSAADLLRFRELASLYGATGYSWWDWQETSAAEWADLVAPLSTPAGFAGVETAPPLLAEKARGDDVLWLQEHLATAIPAQQITGTFGTQTTQDLESFQTARGIPPTGQTDPTTWAALLALPPVAVDWGSAPAPTG